MGRAFNSIEKVIDLESAQGYQDKAVVGGMGNFTSQWVSQAQAEAVDEADLALIEQIAETLSGYGQLPGTEARAKAITLVGEKLRVRSERLGTTAQAKPAAPRETRATVPAASKSAAPKSAAPKPAIEKPQPVEDEVDDEAELAVADPEQLRRPVSDIRGVGRVVAGRLETMGLRTIKDLLYHFPRRYDDYTLLRPINRLSFGEQVTIIGTVWETRLRQVRKLKLVESVITDGTGKVQATWFNQPWLAEKLKAGQQIVLSGTVDQYLGRPVF